MQIMPNDGIVNIHDELRKRGIDSTVSKSSSDDKYKFTLDVDFSEVCLSNNYPR